MNSSGLLAAAALEYPPARSAAPALQPTPEVRLVDLQALKDESAALSKVQAERLDEQSRRLSRTASSLLQLEEELRGQAKSSKALDASLAGLSTTLGDLDKRLAELKQSSAAKDVEGVSQATRLKGLSDELTALKKSYEGDAKLMRDGLAEIQSLRDDLKARQSKLDALTDLLTVIKKDVDANSEEIVEVKQALKLYEKAPEKKDVAEEWWEQALTWKYLPATAVGVALTALVVAATHK